MFEKKAFIHWYTGEGMDEEEFCIARNNVLDVSNEYEEAGIDQCGEYYDDDCICNYDSCPLCSDCNESRCVCECVKECC